MDHREVKSVLGLDYTMKIPASVEVPWKLIDGVYVCYLTSADARAFWKKPGTNTPMRALARCPECGKITAASRINQHARVHHGGVRKGY